MNDVRDLLRQLEIYHQSSSDPHDVKTNVEVNKIIEVLRALLPKEE